MTLTSPTYRTVSNTTEIVSTKMETKHLNAFVPVAGCDLHIKVKGRWEYGHDDSWLGPGGLRTWTGWKRMGNKLSWNCTQRLWEYHQEQLYDRRWKYFGSGNSSPDLEKVSKFYAHTFTCNGKEYKCVLQNRVNPEHCHIQTEGLNQISASNDPHRNFSLVI